MGATGPGQVIERFVELFNGGQIDTLLGELYEDDAVLVPGPGAPIAAGKDAIREVLQAFLAMGGNMSLAGSTTVPAGELALTHNRWRLDVPGSDPMEGTTAEVVRRQADGSWRYVIDNPFGGSVLEAAG